MRHDTPLGNGRPTGRHQARSVGRPARPLLALLALALALPGALLAGARPAGATEHTITVGTRADQAQDCATPTAVVPCSLRWAIQEANGRPAGDHTTIVLPEGVYTLARPAVDPASDTNLTGDLDIAANVTIRGVGAATTVIDGGALDRIFTIEFGRTVAISGVTIRNGSTTNTGGGILNAGTLSLTNAVIGGNVAENSTAFSAGGGIDNGGRLSLVSAAILGNRATGIGGGLYNTGTLTATNATIADNRTAGYGGGIVNLGTGTVSLGNSTVSGNVADNATGYAAAGGIDNYGTLFLLATTVSDNRAKNLGGGISNSGLLTATDTTVARNQSASGGGGIYTNGIADAPTHVALTRSRITGNRARYGGGIVIGTTGNVTLTDSTVDDNVAENAGAIHHTGQALVATGSTISNNRVADTSTDPNAVGGLGLYGYSGTNPTATLTNVTISGNSAGPAAGPLAGGGLAIQSPPTQSPAITLSGVTIAANTPGIALWGGTLNLVGSVLADAAAGNCRFASLGLTLTDLGHNIESGGSCGLRAGAGSASDADPQLLPLADNGGPTRTHALAPGSSAINRLPPGTACPGTDQRGIARPQGAACDAGAYELVPAPLPPAPGFGDLPFPDPAYVPVGELARRAIINGCDGAASPPLFCPADGTLRHQMAALIVRAMPGWAAETGLPTFTDNTDDAELMTRVATLQRHGVVGGYNDCAAQGKASPCYGPTDPVLRAQAISFVTRAMVRRGYWQDQPTDPALYGGALLGTGHEGDASTYWHYTRAKGGVPDYPEVGPFPTGEVAPRAWFAQLLWVAIAGSPAAP